MTNFILTCSCGGMRKKAAEAFSLLFPTEVLPDIVRGRDRIYKLAIKTGNPHIRAISKLGGRYAYYIELNEHNEIVTEYDLVKGTKLR